MGANLWVGIPFYQNKVHRLFSTKILVYPHIFSVSWGYLFRGSGKIGYCQISLWIIETLKKRN